MKHCSDFRADLIVGQEGEKTVATILGVVENDGIEVKRDLQSHQTGNIAIEYMSRGKPSGITTTESKYWAIILEKTDTVIIIATERLKKLCKTYGRKVYGGDNNTSKLILLPLKVITAPVV